MFPNPPIRFGNPPRGLTVGGRHLFSAFAFSLWLLPLPLHFATCLASVPPRHANGRAWIGTDTQSLGCPAWSLRFQACGLLAGPKPLDWGIFCSKSAELKQRLGFKKGLIWCSKKPESRKPAALQTSPSLMWGRSPGKCPGRVA